MNQNSNIWSELFKMLWEYPSSFFRQINIENFKTLKRAIQNEPKDQIIRNIKSLLIKTNNDSIEDLEFRIKDYFNKINLIKNKPCVILISHEATRTGAPFIILNIAKYLKENFDYQIIQILCKGGDIRLDFENIEKTYDLKYFHNKPLLKKEIKYIVNEIRKLTEIKATLFNSEASTRLLSHFSNNKVKPLISLIHEMGNYYPDQSWNHVSKYSDHIIFPCDFVRKLAIENSFFKSSKIIVEGQGLMKPELLNTNKTTHKKFICNELNLNIESKIILGCGSMIPRKGIDLFVHIAINVLRQSSNQENIHFIWLGDAPNNEHQIWVKRDVQQSKLESNIHFIGSKKDTVPYFSGSDVFLMTSRGDPFPCVVHEALAAGLPVVGFENSGGIPEMIKKNFGYIVPYADINSSALKILELIQNQKALTKKSTAARKHAKQHLDFNRYVHKINAIIQGDC